MVQKLSKIYSLIHKSLKNKTKRYPTISSLAPCICYFRFSTKHLIALNREYNFCNTVKQIKFEYDTYFKNAVF